MMFVSNGRNLELTRRGVAGTLTPYGFDSMAARQSRGISGYASSGGRRIRGHCLHPCGGYSVRQCAGRNPFYRRFPGGSPQCETYRGQYPLPFRSKKMGSAKSSDICPAERSVYSADEDDGKIICIRSRKQTITERTSGSLRQI